MRSVQLIVLLLCMCIPVTGQNVGARGFFDLGADAFRDGDYYSAIEHYKAALAINPNYVDPVSGLAESFFFLGEYAEALKYVRRAQPLDRTNFALLTLEGRILVGLGDFENASFLFSQVLDSEPNNIGAWFGLAELDLAFGKMTQATERYRRALQVSPGNRRALLSLILVLDAMDLEREASSLVEEALDYYPRNAQVRYIVAKHYHAAEETSAAEFHALKALDLDPEYREAALLLSTIYMQANRYPGAIRVLEDLLGADRKQAIVWYALGTAYRRTGRVEEAMNAFAFAIRYRPDDEIARLSLERVIMDTLEFSDSRRERYAAYHINIGKEHEARNYLDRALRSYRRALLLDPHSKEGRLLYADVFRVQGYFRKYLNELNVLLDLGYDDAGIRDSIEIQESLASGSVAESWGVDQYLLQRHEIIIDVHIAESDLHHLYAEADLGAYAKNLLLHHEHVSIPADVQVGSSFADAYSHARNGKSDYFLIADFEETGRYFVASVSMYSSRTGGLLKEISAVRTGNQRVADALQLIIDEIHRALPLSGTILDRRFTTAFLDLGMRDGLDIDDEYFILKPDDLKLATDRIAFDYDADSVLGTVRISQLDELVAEAEIEQGQFFDLVNIGDRIVAPAEEVLEGESVLATRSEGLYQSVLRIK